YFREIELTSSATRFLYSADTNALFPYRRRYASSCSGKCFSTNAKNVGREHGFKNSAPDTKKLALASAAARATASIDARLSVIPGISGEHITPARIPPSRSRRTAPSRRSGLGARGSRIRARFTSIVVTVTCT